MAKYLLLKHYRGGPERQAHEDVPMDQWTPEEISDHIAFMDHVADTLRERGEFVEGQALSPEGTFVRFDGEGKPPVTDGPFAETKDLIAGWMVIDVDSVERAHEAAAFLSSAPGPGRPADPRVDRGPAVPARRRRPSPSDRADVDEPVARWCRTWARRCSASSSAAEPTSRRPRTPCRRRWSRPYGAGPTDRSRTTRRRWLVTVAWRKFLDPVRSESARRAREERVVDEPPPGADRAGRRHAAAAVPVLPPGADARVGGRADAAGGRRADHPPDRRGVPRARGDDGAADQPGQAHRRRRRGSRGRATCATC